MAQNAISFQGLPHFIGNNFFVDQTILELVLENFQDRVEVSVIVCVCGGIFQISRFLRLNPLRDDGRMMHRVASCICSERKGTNSGIVRIYLFDGFLCCKGYKKDCLSVFNREDLQ